MHAVSTQDGHLEEKECADMNRIGNKHTLLQHNDRRLNLYTIPCNQHRLTIIKIMYVVRILFVFCVHVRTKLNLRT